MASGKSAIASGSVRRPRFLIMACLALLSAPLLRAPRAASAEAATNAPAAKANSFEDFKLIGQRNVFNQKRSPARVASNRPPPPPPRIPKVEAFGLVGTMSYEKGSFAVFDGTSSAYRKVIQVGGTVGGYTVAEVAHDHVNLKSGEHEIQLPLRKQLRREDEGEWKLLSMTDNFTAPNSPASSPGGSRNFSAGSRTGPSISDATRGGNNFRDQAGNQGGRTSSRTKGRPRGQ